MARTERANNRVKAYRQSRGWTQLELARRAGVARASVSAIEVQRLIPSVAVALSLAAALGCTVDDLFGGTASGAAEAPQWAWPPHRANNRYWHARLSERIIHYPVETPAACAIPHDGVCQNGSLIPSTDADPATTLVLASCDPAAGLLAGEYARSTGFRLLVLERSSRHALALLGQQLVHVAGVHFSTPADPEGNQRMIRNILGPGYCLLRAARWQAGLALASGLPVSSASAALRANLRWVGRETGSAARQCLDELFSHRPPPRRIARHHRGVVEAVRCGWADIGVCHRLVSEEAGLGFLPIRQEHFDLTYPAAAAKDPRIQALVRVVRSSSYRRLLGELPGYDVKETGELHSSGSLRERHSMKEGQP